MPTSNVTNDRVQKASLYFDSRSVTTLRDASLESTSNTTPIAVQGGNVLQQGTPTGTITGNTLVTKSSGLVRRMFEAMKESRVLRVTYAMVGAGDSLQSQCVIASLNLQTSHEDGSQTFAISLTMIEGIPDIL